MAKYDYFISYSSKDKDIAFRIVNAIESAGYTCWIAPRNIPYGTPYARAIMEGIDECDTFIVLITDNSIKSEDVLKEVDNAHADKKTIIPVKLTNTTLYPRELNYYLSRTQWLLLSPKNPKEITTLLNLDSKDIKNGFNGYKEKPNIKPMPHYGVDSSSPSYPAPSPCSAERPSPNHTYSHDIKHCPAPTTPKCQQSIQRETYGVAEAETVTKQTGKRSIWSKLFGKKGKAEMVNASAYAPAEIIPCKHFIVRIFVHKPEESCSVDQAVKDVDKTAVKKANKPLDIPVKNGDSITIQLSMSNGVTMDDPIQRFVWRGHYIECDFGCQLTNSNLYSVLGKAIIAINNVPCGDLKFAIDVVSEENSKVYAPVDSRRYSKIFISYAHADYSQVRGIAEGCKMNGSDYFFDRHTLQAGDIFKDKILQYIVSIN